MFKKILTVWFLLAGMQIIDAGYFIDEYYVSYPLKFNWYEANRYCTYHGMHLIDVPHEKEYNRILSVINTVRQNKSVTGMGPIYTSGVRFGNEQAYYWETTGQPVMYAPWHPGDPQFGTEKCLFLNKDDNKLADITCEFEYVFMCRESIINPMCNACRTAQPLQCG